MKLVRHSSSKRSLAFSLALALAALSAGACSDSPATPVPQNDAPLRQVRVAPAAETLASRTVSASGTLAADDQFVLGTKVIGRLGEISVDLGSRVKKGQAIARIDQSDYRLRVEQADAALQQARVRLGLPATGNSDKVDIEQTSLVRQAAAVLKEARLSHDRMVELWDRKLIARAELDTAVSQLVVAEGRYQDAIEEVRNRLAVLVQRRSELEIARQQLADTAIVSPIDGAVSERQAAVGQYLPAGAAVVTLVRTHPLRLRLPVPEREAALVRTGQIVHLSVGGDPNQYQGRVARLSPAIAESSRTLMIEAEVPNERGALRPGAFAKADIVIESGQRIVTVPRDSIVTFAGIEKLFTIANNTAVERRVRTGRSVDDRVEIIEGIAAGDEVVTRPGNLVNGEPVQLIR